MGEEEEILVKAAEEAWKGEMTVTTFCNNDPSQIMELLEILKKWGELTSESESGEEGKGISRVSSPARRYGRIGLSSGTREEWFHPRPLNCTATIVTAPPALIVYAYSPVAGAFLEILKRYLVKLILPEAKVTEGLDAKSLLSSLVHRPEPFLGPPVKIPLEGGSPTGGKWWLAGQRVDRWMDVEPLLDLFTLAIYVACLHAAKERVTPTVYDKALARTLVNREDRAFKGARGKRGGPLALPHLLELAREEGVKLPRAIRACYGFDDERSRLECLREYDKFVLEHVDLVERICSGVFVKHRLPYGEFALILALSPTLFFFGGEEKDELFDVALNVLPRLA